MGLSQLSWLLQLVLVMVCPSTNPSRNSKGLYDQEYGYLAQLSRSNSRRRRSRQSIFLAQQNFECAADHIYRKAVEVAKLSDDGTHKNPEALLQAEAAASRTIATESALKPVDKRSSWWPSMSFWTKEVNKPPTSDSTKSSQETPKEKP